MQRLMKILISIYILKYIEAENCGNGCLICSKQDICLLCDLTNFYVKQGFTCIKNEIANCERTFDGITCYKCNNGYYLEPIKKETCIKLNTEPLKNCNIQISETQCDECLVNYYISNGKCVQITTQIENCSVYESDKTCKRCSNSQLSEDHTKCNSVSKTTYKCLLYSYQYYCTSCLGDMMLEANKYLKKLQTDLNFIQQFFKEVTYKKFIQSDISSNSSDVCMQKITNCKKYKYYNVCLICEEGYFLNSGNGCTKNPEQKINNCLLYSSATICTLCYNQYYLLNNVCIKHADILQCDKYSTTEKDTCVQCQDNYYYQEDNKQCKMRVNNVEYCNGLQTKADACSSCINGFLIDPSYKKCHQTIPNCKQHYFLSISTNNQYYILCSQCTEGNYLFTQIVNGYLQTECHQPDIQLIGCQLYQESKTCIQCVQNYYLANFQCFANDTKLTNLFTCEAFSVTEANICENCSENQITFQLSNYCSNVEKELDNCVKYDSNAKCEECSDLFYLQTDAQSNQKCIQTQIDNCKKVAPSENICINCDKVQGLMPNINKKDNKCVSIPSFITQQCQEYSIDLSDRIFQCISCVSPFYPMNFLNKYYQFCVSYGNLNDIYEGITTDDIKKLTSCQSFDFTTKGCLICDQTSNTPFISSSLVCVQECNTNELILNFFFENDYPSAQMKCVQRTAIHMDVDSSSNCKRGDYDVSKIPENDTESEITQLCAECISGYLPMLSSVSQWSYTHFDYLPLRKYSNVNSKTSFFSPWNKVPLFELCVTYTASFMSNNYIDANITTSMIDYQKQQLISYGTSSNFFELNWDKFKNCMILISEVNNGIKTFGCLSCNFGYSGAILKSKNGTPFIYNCLKIENCNTSVYYQGIGNIHKNAMQYVYVNCYKCDNNMVVTISPMQPWSQQNEANIFLNSSFTKGYFPSTICLQKGIISSNETSFPSNCAIQMIIASTMYQKYTPNLSIEPNPVCIACNPKYSPTFSNSNITDLAYPFIVQCTKITNCKNSVSFNQCDQCEDNFVLKYDSNNIKELSYRYNCVQNQMQGCLIGNKNGACYQCKGGYILNASLICDNANVQNCSSYGQLGSMESIYKFLTLNPFGQGCLTCTNNMYSVRLGNIPSMCVESSTAFAQMNSLSFFIENCSIYGYENKKLICQKCDNEYYKTYDQTFCIQSKINNCLYYQYHSDSKEFSCYQCADGYYLTNNNKCEIGQITNCSVYYNRNNCKKCADGMIATNVFYSQYTICFDLKNISTNCIDINQNLGYQGIFSCDQCKNQKYKISFPQPYFSCAGFIYIPHCTKYDSSDNLVKSSFICLQCENDYYVDNENNLYPNNCKLRVNNPINNCKEYEIDQDQCKQCYENFYLDQATKLTCNINPQGIIGCRKYTDITNCLECDGSKKYYAQKGLCILVPDIYIIESCYTYDEQIICQNCGPGKILASDVCISSLIANCEKYYVDGSCQQCDTGYILYNNICSIPVVMNCLNYKSLTECLECEENYYLSAGVCTLQDTPIINCMFYTGKAECRKCVSGYILSSDKTSCTKMDITSAYFNSNCDQYFASSQCSVCEPGYYFVFENQQYSCIACKTTNCLFCDFQNDEQCIMCDHGFHMNKLQKCVSDVQKDTGAINTQIEIEISYWQIEKKLYMVFFLMLCLI